MTSGPVWALIIANFCTDWGLYTYLTNIPTFYREVLNFDIQSVSIILIALLISSLRWMTLEFLTTHYDG